MSCCWTLNNFYSHEEVPCFVVFTDIRAVNTSPRLTSPTNLRLTFVVRKNERSSGSFSQAFAGQLQRGTGVELHSPSGHGSVGYSVIVSNIWRALCFLLLVQQDLDTNPFLEVYRALPYLIWKDPRLWTPVFKSPVTVLISTSYTFMAHTLNSVFDRHSVLKLGFWIVLCALRVATSLPPPTFLASNLKWILKPLANPE